MVARRASRAAGGTAIIPPPFFYLMIMPHTLPPSDNALYRNVSYLLMTLALWAVLQYHLLPLLLAIILTFVFITRTNGLILWLCRRLLPRHTVLQRFASMRHINLFSSTMTIGLVLLGIFLFALSAFQLLSGERIGVMLGKLAAILEDTKNSKDLPAFILNLLPDNLDEVKTTLSGLIREYSDTLTRISRNSLTIFVHILIGILIGTMLSFHRLRKRHDRSVIPVFKAELLRRVITFQSSFERVFIAQVKISLIDTALTGIYLYAVLPIFGVELPFRLTVLAIAFIVGLIPVVGNLISNAVIIILSLGVSLYVALASLTFLVVIHKLEYFLNAKIIGAEIESTAWELLLVMVIFERIFGIGGIIIAPVYYAYVKNELKRQGLL